MSSHTIELAAAAASLRDVATGSKVSVEHAIDDCDGDEEAGHIARRGRRSNMDSVHASSLDIARVGSVSSLNLPPSHTLTNERVRRLSELSRHPLDSPPVVEPEAIELPVLTKHEDPYDRGTSSAVRPTDISFHHDVVFTSQRDDVEIAPSFPSSLAPSIRIDEDTNSTAPAMSVAQKAIQRRKRLISFMTLYFVLFMEGWNDGTTGPLLPRIQAYYGVSIYVPR